MKTIPIALATHYAQRATTIALFMKVTRRDNVVFGLTSTDRAHPIDGVTYYPGFSMSNFVSSSGLDVDNMEVTVFPGTALMTQSELAAGIWDNAQFSIFEANFKALSDGINLLKRGTTGEAQLNESTWTIEFRSLTQAFQQSIGEVTSKTCRYRLGAAGCNVDLTPHTFACTVTAVASRQQFTDSARTEDDEWFVEGPVTFLTGQNGTGSYSGKVKVFASGQFTLALPMPFEVIVGDTFTAITGCQKRHDRTTASPAGVSDCIDKFDNILNFGGEPHLPGPDGLSALPPRRMS